MGTGNYSATSNNLKLVRWPLVGGLLHLVQRGKDWAGPQPAEAPSRCTKCNSPPVNGQCIPVTVLLYNGSLLCDFNVPIKGLRLLFKLTTIYTPPPRLNGRRRHNILNLVIRPFVLPSVRLLPNF